MSGLGLKPEIIAVKDVPDILSMKKCSSIIGVHVLLEISHTLKLFFKDQGVGYRASIGVVAGCNPTHSNTKTI